MPFQPTDLTTTTPPRPPFFSSDPAEEWTPILSHPCSFSADIFEGVILNLIKNPNINSGHLFRADILYDSQEDLPAAPQSNARDDEHENHLQDQDEDEDETTDRRIKDLHIPGLTKSRSIVRKLIPRKPNVDAPLLQTCHIFVSPPTAAATAAAAAAAGASSQDHGTAASEEDDDASQSPLLPEPVTLAVYIPHASGPSKIPFYHPCVRGVGFLHTPSTISIHYSLYASVPLCRRLRRTATHLLSTIHKHGTGCAAGYTKRVHHDRIIPQARYQDTYTRLKLTHATRLIESWKEVTDPGKHVFEDLGIAAFLIELWSQMYGGGGAGRTGGGGDPPGSSSFPPSMLGDVVAAKERFPGFVDIGCGNGILVDVLREEGWKGWGFDARRRKSWDGFPGFVQDSLKEALLVPELLLTPQIRDELERLAAANSSIQGDDGDGDSSHDGGRHGQQGRKGSTIPIIHNGIFPASTFIISNHADELTGWTPLLAAQSGHCPFLIIPCCSHDLGGARFRAPPPPPPSATSTEPSTTSLHPTSFPPPRSPPTSSSPPPPQSSSSSSTGSVDSAPTISAYASLVEWVARLSTDLGYVVERDMLRIPSTRNAALLGRRLRHSHATPPSSRTPFSRPMTEDAEAKALVDEVDKEEGDKTPFLTPSEILARETRATLNTTSTTSTTTTTIGGGGGPGEAWIERVVKLMKTQGKGKEGPGRAGAGKRGKEGKGREEPETMMN
ncbi:MAG: tRNA(Ser) Um(44) 2'-O-methyltransferase [Sclerophora amabilis]|nr:MAG: tRNA(Ser) Um(44) 2'-O-methyltransferase [Sclerophora amabilis]